MAKNTKAPTGKTTPPRIVVQANTTPTEPPKAPTAAERLAGYARAYPERIPVLGPTDSVLVLHPLGFYVQHNYSDVVAVQRRALRDEAKALIRAAMSGSVPADWTLPEATRFESDGSRSLGAAPEAEIEVRAPINSLDDM